MKILCLLCAILIFSGLFGNLQEISAQTDTLKPKIISQTHSFIGCMSDSVSIKIDVNGTNLYYSWYKDNDLLENAVDNSLTIQKLTFANSGVYQCVVQNEYGIDSSKKIGIYVISETQIITQPKTMNFVFGQSTVLSLVAHQIGVDGYVKPQFQWYRDSMDLIATYINYAKNNIDPKIYPPDSLKKYIVYQSVPIFDSKKYEGSHSDKLTIKKTNSDDRINYHCVVTGKCGTVKSKIVTIGENTHFEIIKMTSDYTACAGDVAKFKIKVIQKYPGTLSYRWFKTGLKELNDNSKYSGTKTPQLLINNVQKEDNYAYYCLVTLEEYDISQQSPLFIIDTEYKPEIANQTSFFLVLDQTSYYYGTLNLEVRLYNPRSCLFEWYKGDSLIYSQMTKFASAYKVSPPGYPPYQAKESDEGKYIVKITNNCGVTWSDTMTVVFGNYPTVICEGNDTRITIKDSNPDTTKYFYSWKIGNKILKDTKKYIGLKTNTLSIKNVTVKDDNGLYELWGTYLYNNKSFLIGKTWLNVSGIPTMQKDLPDSLNYVGASIPKTNLVFKSNGPTGYLQAYFNDAPYGGEKEIKFDSFNQTSAIFIIGNGGDFNFGDGVYQFKYRDNCGEVTSNRMVIKRIKKAVFIEDSSNIVDDEKPIVISNIQDNNEFVIQAFPNPAKEMIYLQFNNINSEKVSISAINMLGIEYNFRDEQQIQLSENLLSINLSQLPTGIYLLKVKIGNHYQIIKIDKTE